MQIFKNTSIVIVSFLAGVMFLISCGGGGVNSASAAASTFSLEDSNGSYIGPITLSDSTGSNVTVYLEDKQALLSVDTLTGKAQFGTTALYYSDINCEGDEYLFLPDNSPQYKLSASGSRRLALKGYIVGYDQINNQLLTVKDNSIVSDISAQSLYVNGNCLDGVTPLSTAGVPDRSSMPDYLQYSGGVLEVKNTPLFFRR
jgi:hypothetical protein